MKSRFIFKLKRLAGARRDIHFFASIDESKNRFNFNALCEMTRDSGTQISRIPHKMGLSAEIRLKKAYSAATSASLAWAADRMKSEIRGTISDRKREPLNTP